MMTPSEVIAMRDKLTEWMKEQFGWADSVRRDTADRLIKSGWVVAPPKNEGENDDEGC